jgi:hypothetical protein
MQQEEKYSYSAQPHAAPVKKNKYRSSESLILDDQNIQPQHSLEGNIMYDSRVARGNTYAAKVLTNNDKERLSMESRKNSRKGTNNYPGSSRSKNSGRTGTPPAVDGRVHMKMQTEDFLEEINDRPVEQDAETQTLPYMDRPPSPLFIRSKIGTDITTQIEDGDLFDFDIEVEPLLELLVGKTIHVSMLELMQEVNRFFSIKK